MAYDSKFWNWGVGFCEKHRGCQPPCKRCISTNDPDLFDDSKDQTEIEDVNEGPVQEDPSIDYYQFCSDSGGSVWVDSRYD